MISSPRNTGLLRGGNATRWDMEVTEEDAFRILKTANHTCGHGEDTDPPLRFALRHFRDKTYSSGFF